MTEVLDSHLKVMNAALARIAGGQIMAEDEDTELAAQVIAIYYARLDAVLGMHDWSFAGKTFKLDAVPKDADHDYDATDKKFITGWLHAFLMPGTRLSLPRRLLVDPRRPDSPLRDFSIEQNVVYADHEKLYGTFTVRADPIAWKKDFALGIKAIVAADLCVPVTHDSNLAATIRTEAEGTPQEQGRGGLIGRALAADAAGARRVAPVWNDPLSSARMS